MQYLPKATHSMGCRYHPQTLSKCKPTLQHELNDYFKQAGPWNEKGSGICLHYSFHCCSPREGPEDDEG